MNLSTYTVQLINNLNMDGKKMKLAMCVWHKMYNQWIFIQNPLCEKFSTFQKKQKMFGICTTLSYRTVISNEDKIWLPIDVEVNFFRLRGMRWTFERCPNLIFDESFT